MRVAGDALFNLLVNAAASFWVGLAAAAFLLTVFKPRGSWLAVLLLCLPFVKLLWDLRGGIPADSFFWAHEHGVKQRLGSFQIGFGARPFGPTMAWQLMALHAGGRSPQSIADLACRALTDRVWKYAAATLGFSVLAVSLCKVGLRTIRYVDFRQQLARIRAARPELETRAVGRRMAQIVTSSAYAGVPFAAGIRRPCVVLPHALTTALSPEEREAVVAHELGHIAHYDLPLLLAFEVLCDLFWYIPGKGALLAYFRRLLEERADDAAVAAGVPRPVLVSALLNVAERIVATGPPPILAITRSGSSLRARIQRLLTPSLPDKRPGRTALVLRALLIAWIVLGALQAAACGNHPV
jgi:Zn-dependent protease with chaperone function